MKVSTNKRLQTEKLQQIRWKKRQKCQCDCLQSLFETLKTIDRNTLYKSALWIELRTVIQY